MTNNQYKIRTDKWRAKESILICTKLRSKCPSFDSLTSLAAVSTRRPSSLARDSIITCRKLNKINSKTVSACRKMSRGISWKTTTNYHPDQSSRRRSGTSQSSVRCPSSHFRARTSSLIRRTKSATTFGNCIRSARTTTKCSCCTSTGPWNLWRSRLQRKRGRSGSWVARCVLLRAPSHPASTTVATQDHCHRWCGIRRQIAVQSYLSRQLSKYRRSWRKRRRKWTRRARRGKIWGRGARRPPTSSHPTSKKWNTTKKKWSSFDSK